MSVVRFFSGPVKFTIGRHDHVDRLIRQHMTSQGVLMKREMATRRLYLKPDDTGMGLKICVDVFHVELARTLQYKWGTIFLQELLWSMVSHSI